MRSLVLLSSLILLASCASITTTKTASQKSESMTLEQIAEKSQATSSILDLNDNAASEQVSSRINNSNRLNSKADLTSAKNDVKKTTLKK